MTRRERAKRVLSSISRVWRRCSATWTVRDLLRITARDCCRTNNRHVLRSAARLFFQVRDFERAHDLIRRNESTLGDPWLMAAEVALSGFAERRSTFMK